MMKAWLYQCGVVVACCIGMSGCTISQWVTDSRTEVLPEATATTVRPILDIDQLSQERPVLLVKLRKQLEGPIELQERKHAQIHTIWGNRLHNIGFAWLAFPLSPIYLVLETLQGKPGEGVSAVVNTFLAATGFNAMEGSMFHISEERGADKIDKTPMGSGTRTELWPFGVVEVKADDQAPIRLQANEDGYVAIDLKQLPVQLSQRSNDLALSISAPGGTVTVAKSVTVPVSTMVAWEQQAAARAKLEEENKAQAERDRLAQEWARAVQARAAEEERRASIKAAEEKRLASIQAAAAAPPTPALGSSSSGGTLRWPTEGGIEEWAGFSRPSSCAPDLYYLKPLYDAVNSKTGLNIAFRETKDSYTSSAVTDFIKDPNVLAIMQKDLDRFAEIGTDARAVANSVTRLSSSPGSPASVIKEIRSLRFDNPQCGAAASGARDQYFCGTAVKLLELTHRIEGMIQIACRMRIAPPIYAPPVNLSVPDARNSGQVCAAEFEEFIRRGEAHDAFIPRDKYYVKQDLRRSIGGAVKSILDSPSCGNAEWRESRLRQSKQRVIDDTESLNRAKASAKRPPSAFEEQQVAAQSSSLAHAELFRCVWHARLERCH